MAMKFCHSVAEAQQKQCCGPDPCGFFNDNPYPARWCNTSACMAWRWVTTHINNPHDPKADLMPSSDTHGFCGLAGEP